MELIKIDSSETLLINELSKNEIEKNQVVKFGFGQSPFLPPDQIVDSLRLNASSRNIHLFRVYWDSGKILQLFIVSY